MSRGGSTKWKAGQSGNPGGRPKILEEVKSLAREKGRAAFERIVELMGSDDERVAFAAAKEVLDRAYGKAPQHMEITKRQHLTDISDAELAAIALSRRAGAHSEADGPSLADPVH
ncbi:MAG: hypothetical protein E6Q97_16830 [Desulfurellales bacterium]|nr:MAG: hypothetical protein E6Q97_16830 [Desulfurellales bacterium]